MGSCTIDLINAPSSMSLAVSRMRAMGMVIDFGFINRSFRSLSIG